ncbi:MAG: hypothetical protein R3C10_10875 [Pirellulales bacterium]
MQPQPKSTRRRPAVFAMAAFTTLLTAAGLALVLAPHGVDRLLQHSWAQRFAALNDEQAVAELDQIAALGDASLRPLAAAMGSPRESVARRAHALLAEKLDGYRRLPVSTAEASLAAMTDALVDASDGYGPTADEMAAQLAGRIASWHFDKPDARTERIVVATERLLRTARNTFAPTRPLHSDGPPALRQPESPLAGSVGFVEPDDENRALDLIAPLPGGGLRPVLPNTDDADADEVAAPAPPVPELPAIAATASIDSPRTRSAVVAGGDPSASFDNRAASLAGQRDDDGAPDADRFVQTRGTHTSDATPDVDEEPPLYAVLRQLASSDTGVRIGRGGTAPTRFQCDGAMGGPPQHRRRSPSAA